MALLPPGNADAGFHRGADTVNPFDAGDLVEMEVADSAGVRFVEFLIAQVGAVDGHRIVGVSEHGGHLPCQGVVHALPNRKVLAMNAVPIMMRCLRV